MVSSPDGYPTAIEYLSKVMWVDAIDGKAHQSRTVLGCRSKDAYAFGFFEPVICLAHQFRFVLVNCGHADGCEESDGGPQPDGFGNRRCARFELPRQLVPLRTGAPHSKHHLAAGHERRHALEQLLFAIQHPDTIWSTHLVPRKCQEVAIP